MSLWVDKYRPTSLGKLDYHKEQATELKNLVRENNLMHPADCVYISIALYSCIQADIRKFTLPETCSPGQLLLLTRSFKIACL